MNSTGTEINLALKFPIADRGCFRLCVGSVAASWDIFSVYIHQVGLGAGIKQGFRFIDIIANSGKYWQKLVFQYSEVFNIQDTDANILSWLIPTSGVSHKIIASAINCWYLTIFLPFMLIQPKTR